MHPELSAIALRRIDAACDNYEAAWRDGRQPRIEDYLVQGDPSEQLQLLESLQKLQQELILKQMAGAIKLPPPTLTLPSQSSAETNAGIARQTEPRGHAPHATRGDSAGIQTVKHAGALGQLPKVDETPLPHDEPATAEGGARVTLKVVGGPHKGLEFTYDEHNTLLVGRSVHAQLRLKDDPHFSRHHFRLEANPPSCFVMDLGSRNGTFVNGERVSESYLKDGDVVSGGRTKMLVSIQNAPSSSAPPVPLTSAGATMPQASSRPSQHATPRSASTPHAVESSNRIIVTNIEPIPKGNPTSSPATNMNNGDQPGPIAGYLLHEQLGTGDLGSVYRATRLATQEECALKIISPAARADEKSIQTFLREASILNQLQHQYIVRLIELGSSGSNLYLSTEYLKTLDWQELSAHWPLTQRIRIACGIMVQILSALDHAHARSMVHRDVKPGNILLSRVQGKLQGKLADFGLAKHYTTAGMSQMTREGDVIGSLPFMSPEQFINSREAKPACDLYSAGATLYWMITGQHPILLENHPCKFLAILEDAPVPIQNHCSEIPAALAQLIHRALEKSPDKRFISASEMRQHLRRFVR